MSHDADFNPYQSPDENSLDLGGASPSHRTVQLLMETKPWVRLIGILGIIGVVLMVLGALGLAVAAMGSGQLQLMAIAAVYVVMAVVYIFPIRYLLQYASRIQDFARDGTTEHLDRALESQKSFWKFVGILMVIVVGFYALFFVAMIVFGTMGAFV